LVVLGAMLVLNPTLRHPAAWERMSRNWAQVALLAIGLTPIIITGGIDLSVGSVVGLSAVVAGFLWRDLGCPLEVALAGSVLAGLAAGVTNGALVLAGISPLVVTLATLAVFRGLAYGLSGARSVDNFPSVLRQWWDGSFLGLPQPLWLVLITFALGYLFLHHTWMGRMVFALGDNPAAARYAGVPVRALPFSLYVASGLIAGVAGLASVLEFRSAPAMQGENYELQAIACVVLGGVRITGGAGHLAGTLLGTVTLAAVLQGMVSVPGRWRTLATGVLLIGIALANEGLARLRARWEVQQSR
ncbi:MAG: ABC transporter permease, partial [Gemmataceae bacterium]|nr:ABC transporter permease [Gemmataceae bacterium]